MNETEYLDDLIQKGRQATIRLAEGKDILAIPVAHDRAVVIIRNTRTGDTSMIYKRAIAVITPAGG